MTVSVIITTRNEEADLERCLKSLLRQNTSEKIEIIAVDNNSSDSTKKIARRYTRNVHNIGPERSAQRNFGIEHSNGNNILILDADMELSQTVIDDCLKSIRKHDAIIIPEFYSGNGFWTRCKILEKETYRNSGEGEAARFFRRAVLRKAKGYDETLTGPEDIDLHKRILRMGCRVGRVGSFITHHEGKLSLRSIVRKRYYYSKNLREYLIKNRNEPKGEMRFFREAYLKNWKLFARDPLHTFGFLIMRIGEGLAVILALLRSRK